MYAAPQTPQLVTEFPSSDPYLFTMRASGKQ